jgi:cytochrome P450
MHIHVEFSGKDISIENSSNTTITMEYPPGPSQKFPNQTLLKFMQKPIETLMDFAEKYGDICHFRLGNYRHAYLLNNPDYIDNVLVQHPDNFIKTRALQISRLFLGNGLVTSEGEYHHQHRKLILPNFYPKQISKYAQTMVESCVTACRKWHDQEVIDIHKEMMLVTLSIICKTALGSSIDEKTEEEVRRSVSVCQDYVRERLMPYGDFINKVPLLPINRKFQHALGTLNTIVYGMIREHRKNGSDSNDLISKLLQVRDENNLGMTDDQLRD